MNGEQDRAFEAQTSRLKEMWLADHAAELKRARTLHPLIVVCLIFAARYARGRQTGAPTLVIGALKSVWDRLGPVDREQIIRESFEHAETPDDWDELRAFAQEFDKKQKDDQNR